MYTLYGYHGSASFVPHVILERSGVAYSFVEVTPGEEPPASSVTGLLGKWPTLRVNEVAGQTVEMFESAAISIYLADRLSSPFAVPVAATARGDYLKWIVFINLNLQDAFYPWFYPERYALMSTGQDAAEVARVKSSALERVNHLFGLIDQRLQDQPLLVDAKVRTPDLYLLMVISWHPDREALFAQRKNLARHFAACLQEPVVAQLFSSYDG